MNNGYQPKKTDDETPPAPPRSDSTITPGPTMGLHKFKDLGELETVVVEWDEDLTCFFNWDFYEGQENIELVGVIPVHDVQIKNECNIIISGVKEK